MQLRGAVRGAACLLVMALAAMPAWAGSALVVSQSAATVTRIENGRASATSLPLAKAPAAVVVSTDASTAYVSHPDLGLVSVVDLVGWRVSDQLHVGGQPFGLALTPGGRLLLTDWSGDKLVSLDPAGQERQSLTVGRSPAAVIVDPAAGLAYTIDRESDQVSVVDLRSFSVTANIKVGRAPFAAALSTDGSRLYVANVQSGDLSVIDTRDRRETDRIDIGGMPYGVAVDPGTGTVLVTDQELGRLLLVDPGSHRVTATIRLEDYPEGVVVTQACRAALVANWFSDSVSIIDLVRHTATSLPVSSGPRMLAVTPAALGDLQKCS